MTEATGYIQKILSDKGTNQSFYKAVVGVLRQQNYDTRIQMQEIGYIQQLYSGSLAIQPPRSTTKGEGYALTGSLKQMCYKFLVQEEGFETEAYPKGHPTTIGIGHLILKNEDFSAGLTKEQVDELFYKDLDKHAAPVIAQAPRNTPTKSLVALISLAFNRGSIFKKMYIMLKENRIQDAARYWMHYPEDDPALQPRRKREVSLFLEGWGIITYGR